MKKKILLITMSMLTIGCLFTGCGKKEATDKEDVKTKTESSVQKENTSKKDDTKDKEVAVEDLLNSEEFSAYVDTLEASGLTIEASDNEMLVSYEMPASVTLESMASLVDTTNAALDGQNETMASLLPAFESYVTNPEEMTLKVQYVTADGEVGYERVYYLDGSIEVNGEAYTPAE